MQKKEIQCNFFQFAQKSPLPPNFFDVILQSILIGKIFSSCYFFSCMLLIIEKKMHS